MKKLILTVMLTSVCLINTCALTKSRIKIISPMTVEIANHDIVKIMVTSSNVHSFKNEPNIPEWAMRNRESLEGFKRYAGRDRERLGNEIAHKIKVRTRSSTGTPQTYLIKVNITKFDSDLVQGTVVIYQFPRQQVVGEFAIKTVVPPGNFFSLITYVSEGFNKSCNAFSSDVAEAVSATP